VDSLEERVSRFSAADLDIFKKQLPLRLKELGEVERNTALDRLSRIPQLADLFQPPTEVSQQPIQPISEPVKPWWQQALDVAIFQPLRAFEEHVAQPFGAVLTAPFTPSVPGTEGMSWLARERAEYEQWKEPVLFSIGEFDFKPTKGIIETIPWFATAIATAGLSAVAGVGAKTGLTALTRAAALGSRAIKPVLAAERVINYPIAKPLELIGKRLAAGAKRLIPKTLPETARFTAPAIEAIESVITKDDWQRRIAQFFGRQPFLKSITERIGGRAATVTAAVEDTTARALLIGARTQEILLSKGQTGLATLRQIHPNPVRLFGVSEKTGLATRVRAKAGQSLHMNDIAEHPTNYILTKSQRAYIDQVHRVEDWVLDGLKEAGVEIKLLKFDEFSHWVHREVIGKNVNEVAIKVLKPTVGGRIGKRMSAEQRRFYETALEGVQQGLLYESSLERVVELYMQSAAKRIADQRIAGMIGKLGVTPLERAIQIAPETLRAATATAKTLAGANNLAKVIRRAARGEKLTAATLAAQERRFPELGKQLRGLVAKKDNRQSLQALAKEVDQIVEAAKAPFFKAKGERALLMEQARTPTLGTEATIAHPAFQGRIYPKNVAGEVQKYWDDLGFGPLNTLANISGEMRTLVAAADFSAMFIQGLPAIGRYPKQWARAALMSFRSFRNPTRYQEYLVKELGNLTERATYGGYIGGFEFMEAFPKLQRLAGLGTRVVTGQRRFGERFIRETYGRYEAAFGSFGDVVRNEMWKSLKYKGRTSDELFEIARHIDRMTGVMSSKGLGLGKTQRDFESAFLFFAPRYTRAGFALVGDVFKGGLSGAEARKSLGSMMAAGAVFYSATAIRLGQEPDFDPSSARFMTIELKDPFTGDTRHFGIGGMMTSLMRFGADVAATIADNPQDLLAPIKDGELNKKDNPFIRFMFSKTSPLTSTLAGLMQGQNYFGEPFENAGDYGTFMLERVIPISAQQILESGDFSVSGLIAEQVGLRTFPQSDWEKRDVERDRIAQETFGMSWDEVGRQRGQLAQLQLEQQNPELRRLDLLAKETSDTMARGEGKLWNTWRNDGEAIEDRYQDYITSISEEYELTKDAVQFREKVDYATGVRREMYNARQSDPKYQEIQSFFNEPMTPERKAGMNPLDIARLEYGQLMYAGDMVDRFHNYNFEEAERRERAFVTQYGQETLDYIEEFRGAKWDEPMPMKLLREARKVLEPYWQIANEVWANYSPEAKQLAEAANVAGRTDPRAEKRMLFETKDANGSSLGVQVLWARKWIALMQKRWKRDNPDAARMLRIFYSF